MHFVPVKSCAQQGVMTLHRLREGCKEERNACINRIRGLAAEFGLVLAKGPKALREALPEVLEVVIHAQPGTERLARYLQGSAGLGAALDGRSPAAFTSAPHYDRADPRQMEITFRGQRLSPLLGTPRGSSLYLDAVRMSQPLGDIVSWEGAALASLGATLCSRRFTKSGRLEAPPSCRAAGSACWALPG